MDDITKRYSCWDERGIATEAFVAHCASEWDTGVEEWMDQVQTHFSQQHPESSYAFISVGDNVKMASLSCM